ncbi:hypothetical protein ENSA5_16420 [Enhygromyxa salina]|uniref:Uncharacterized protein n=1 Tax=Enhygromyxa salina TaxID=215803 RepID=A0A2S9YE27_9BACT|nr:hypothetical protein ENSA5_16420 [Enhygromyxa salina]
MWLLGWFVAPSAALAGEARAPDHDRRELRLQATRIDGAAIRVDGKLDEAQWREIPVLPELVQSSPAFGAAATHTTRIRAAYGSDGLYFAFECDEPHGKVIAPFFQRDQIVPSDYVQVEIDSNGDDTNGYVFGVSPSGAIFDGQLFRDTSQELLWDGVWRSAALVTETGWTAEIFVPWATLRFEHARSHTIGLNFTRVINDRQESNRLSFAPQGVPARVSEAIDWYGIEDIDAGLNLELQPYASGRFMLQRPPDSLDQSWRALPNAGFDLKYGITGDLTLDLAVNPDFGQAEVDAAVLNLSPFEVFFPEKRRFFLESKEIFETRFPLFYSRRVGAAPSPQRARTTERTVYGEQEQGELVGLDPLSRVLGSLRMTGQIAPGWVLGVLTAATGPTWGRQRFSDGLEQRVPVDPFSGWSVVRLRRHFDPQTWVGGIVTNAARLGDDPEATTGGFDYNINFRKRWVHGAQVIATHDGEKSGMGGSTSLARSGRRTNWSLSGEFLTPHANFSDLGFMTRNNYAKGSTGVGVFNAQPIGKVRSLTASVDLSLASSFAGQITEKYMMTNWTLETLGLWQLQTFFGGHLPQLDLFETRGNIPYEVPLHWWTGARVSTPRNKRVTASVAANYGEQAGKPGPDLFLDLGFRPVDRLQISFAGQWSGSFGRPRWVAEREADEVPIFARADILTTNVDLRLTLAITPTLSVTSYNQLLYTTAHHDEFLELRAPDLLVPIAADPWFGTVDRGLTSLTSNSILRWEYLPGSFLFVAYTHRTALPEGEGEGEGVSEYRSVRAFTNLVASGARHEDVMFIKLAYLFGL